MVDSIRYHQIKPSSRLSIESKNVLVELLVTVLMKELYKDGLIQAEAVQEISQ